MEIYQIPCLKDNYIYVLHDSKMNLTAVIDPALAKPVNEFLEGKKWSLDFIFNTHHHADHIGGNLELKKKWACSIYGYKGDAHRISGIDCELEDGEEFYFGENLIKVIFTPGHTLGHAILWLPKEKALFCGDTLFALGCGRLFEGSAEQMFSSLLKIKELPKETLVHCAHEYSEKNAEFALSLDSKFKNRIDLKGRQALEKRTQKIKSLRDKGLPTIPFKLEEDLLTNPFLLAENLEKFTKIRQLRDIF